MGLLDKKAREGELLLDRGVKVPAVGFTRENRLLICLGGRKGNRCWR
jgi:hypothetical protein